MPGHSKVFNKTRRYPGLDDGRIVAEFLNSSQKRKKEDLERWFFVDYPIENAIKGANFFTDGTVLLPAMTVPITWSIKLGGRLELTSDDPAAMAMLAAQRLDQIGRLRRVRPRGQELEPCGRWFYAIQNDARFCCRKCGQDQANRSKGKEWWRDYMQKHRDLLRDNLNVKEGESRPRTKRQKRGKVA